MFMHSCARLIVWIVCAAALFALARQGICADVPKWGVHEITLTSPQAHANPFTEVTLQATFSSPSGRTLPVDGFYDGDGNGGQTGNVWKIRFSPDEVGAWTYTTTAVGDANLNGKTGSFSCVNSSSKGPVKVDPMNPHHFRYADGDPFFMRGMWILPMFDNKHDTVRRTNEINWMAAHGYNRVAFGLSGFFPSLGTQIVPWLGSITAWNDASAVDFSGFALSKWKEWDSAILQMKNKGIIADIWFYMDDSPINGAIGAGSALEKMYFRYAIARWGAFTNTWWNLGLETEEYRSNSWRESMGALVKQWDPYDHVLAIHSGATYYAAGTWQDIIVKQLLRMNGNTPAPQLNSAALKDRSRNKPVLFEEFAIETFSGSHNTIRKLAWPVALSGAYPTYLGSGPDPDMYWTTPDTLVEPEFKRLFDFMERTGYRRMSPDNSLVSGGGSANFCLANVGTEYIVYLSAGGTQTLDLSAANGTIPVEWYNPRDGSVQGQTTVAGRGIRSFNAPDANDWVLHIGRSDTAKSGRIAADESWSGKVLITDDLTIVDAAVTVEAGTEVVFAPAVPGHHCVVAIGRRRGSDRSALIIKGTAQRPVTWRTQRDSARGVIKQEDNGGRFYAHYAYFADLGYEKTQAIRCKSTGDGTKFTIDHCAFEDCTAIQAEAGGEVSLVVRDSRFTRRSHCEQQLSLRAMNGSVTVAGNAIEGRLAAGGDTAHIVENVLIGHDAMLLPFGRDVEVRANIVNVNHDMAYTMLTQYKGFERLRIIDNYFRGSAWQMLGGATGTREVIVRGNVFEGTAYSFHTHEALIMIPAYARVSRNFFLDYGVAGHPGCDWPSRRRWAYVNNICRVIGIGTASKVPAKTKPIVRGNVFLRTAGGVGENIFTSGLTAGPPAASGPTSTAFGKLLPPIIPTRRSVRRSTTEPPTTRVMTGMLSSSASVCA